MYLIFSYYLLIGGSSTPKAELLTINADFYQLSLLTKFNINLSHHF